MVASLFCVFDHSPESIVRTNSVLIALIMAGALLRLIAIDLRPADAAAYAPDEPEYIELAQNLWLGNGYSVHGQPTAYRDMLYPAAASVVLRLTGGSLPAVLYLQVLLSCLTGWLIYLLGKRRFTEKIALLLCAAWMLYPMAVVLSVLYLTETLFVFLWVLAIVLYDWLEENPGVVKAVLLGLCLGLLCLTRAVGLLMVAALAIYMVLIRYETQFRDRVRTTLIVVGVCLLTVLPWMIRNYTVMDSFSLNTNGGINLLIGNNRYATGAYRFDEPVQEMLPDATLGEAARDRVGAELAGEYFWSDVKRSLNLWSRKFAFLWSTDIAQLAHYYPDRSGVSLAAYLRCFPLPLLLIMAIPYMLVLQAGTAGFYLVKNFPARGLFILQIGMLTIAAFLSYGMPRYHFPAIPALMIGAAAYVERWPWRAAPPWRRIYLLLVLSMFVGIWSYEAFTILGWEQ
jgi:4-amino-4-deoxy-L-arabinose transferase-like glycosyltransferase